MKKQDLLIVAALVMLLFSWPKIAHKLAGSPQPIPPAPAPIQGTGTNTVGTTGSPTTGGQTGMQNPDSVVTNRPAQAAQAIDPANPANPANPVGGGPAGAANPNGGPAGAANPNFLPGGLPKAAVEPANMLMLTNSLVRLTWTKYGASLIDAELLKYPAENVKGSLPKHLSFTNRPTLAMPGLAGAELTDAWQVTAGDDGRSAVFTTKSGPLQIERSVSLAPDGYEITVNDRFINPTANGIQVPGHDVRLSRFYKETEGMYGASTGIDTRLIGGDVVHLNKMPLIPFLGKSDFNERFAMAEKKSNTKINEINEIYAGAPTWVAVKNKFFCQILTISGSGSFPNAKGLYVNTKRGGKKNMEFSEVASGLFYDGTDDRQAQNVVAPGADLERQMTLFVGPKKFAELEKMTGEQRRIMEFGKMTFLCNPMLRFLNWLYGIIGNYGLAIIFLTFIIRMAFWPLLRKSTRSMKSFSKLAPQMKEIKEKYKGNNLKIQEETMKLYKQHGVSPLAPMKGCLPALLQIPVFFSLFYVLRSAVELRHTKFAWIADLSEPENLFLEQLNFPINILPVTMAITALGLQRMTPMGNVEPMQKKIMMFMPVMFLVFLYRFPSGLCLYYTTSNLIAIFQQYFNLKDKKKQDAKDEAANGKPDDTEVAPPAEDAPEFKKKVKKRKRKK